MKKYLGLLIIILTVFSFNMEVNAAQELTCLYKKESFSDKFILVQKSNGTHVLYKNNNNESFVGNWTVSDEQIKFEDGLLNSNAALDSCPGYINSAGEGVTFYNSGGLGKRKLEDSKNIAQEPYMYSFKASLDFDAKLLNGLCGVSNTEGAGTCTYITNDGSTYNGTYDGVMSSNINSFGGLKEFYVTGANKDLEQLKNYLYERKCSANDSCYEYVKKQYCSNFTSNEYVCKDLKTNEKESDEEQKDVGYCNVPVKFYSSNSTTEMMKFEYNLTNNQFAIVSNNNVNVIVSGVNSFVGDSNTFNLSSKTSSYENFGQKYLDILKNTNSCPEFSFCLYSRDGKRYDWYAEFDGCDKSVYKQSYSQNIKNDGTSDSDYEDNDDGNNAVVGTITKYDNCEAFLSGEGADELIEILRTVILIIKIAIPILLVVLSVLDFAKAIFSGDDQMKKSQAKLIKRIIIAVVIFLVPTLLKWFLSTAHLIWPNISSNMCGIL